MSWANIGQMLGIPFRGYILGISRHIVDISWLYLRHISGIFCTHLGHSSAFAQDIPILCPRYANDMLKIWQRYAQYMHEICPKYGQDMPQICPRYATVMDKIGSRYTHYMPMIRPKYAKDIPRLCPVNTQDRLAHLNWQG